MNDNWEEKLRSFDFRNSSIEEIEYFFSKAILGHTRPTINLSFEGLFRARIITGTNESDLQTTKSIWYPNFKEIGEVHHRLNRCSDKGQNFFYSSNYLGAVIKELAPSNMDLVMIGIFHKKYPQIKMRSQYAGIEALKANPKENLELKDYRYACQKDKLIEQFISSKFQERVEKGEEYKYKPRSALSNILLKNEEINCLIYPSVASDLKSTNYGIKAQFVDEFLYCRSTYIYKIKRDGREFELIPERYGKRIILNKREPKNSKIEWEEIPKEDKEQTRKYYL
ncbi:hypothetical protein [Flagellimonas onchidii]|uniref:hypothetical protein n=1 Tax=Flagellimonas onchidii TaxID=2562684 RepID=UPI0010A5E8A6|nr:hypothetical protein [Allomuricauda onchidii]